MYLRTFIIVLQRGHCVGGASRRDLGLSCGIIICDTELGALNGLGLFSQLSPDQCHGVRRISLERSRPPCWWIAGPACPPGTLCHLSQSCWLAFSGGNIVIRNMASFSSRPNGPGTLWLIAGRLLRYSTMARTSDFVSPAYARHGMMGARTRPSGLTPV